MNKFKDEYIGIQVRTKKVPQEPGIFMMFRLTAILAQWAQNPPISFPNTMDQAHQEYSNPNGKFQDPW